MNFLKRKLFVVCISKTRIVFCLFLNLLLSIYFAGCSDNVLLPSAKQLAEFENAGPVRPSVDMERLVKAKISGGAYRVVQGEVLELTMPTILRVVTAEMSEVPEQVTPYVCRVSESGTITLPVVGEIKAAGKTLAEIESAVIDAYYPKYAVIRPSVFARILEYKTAKVSVTGAVVNQGIYELRSDQMSLVALLMKAGGIVDEGAALIRIIHPEEIVIDDEETPKDTIGEALKQMLRLLSEREQKRTIEQLDEPSETEVVIPPATYRNLNKIEAQLNSEQTAPQSTVGRFITKQNSSSDEVLDKELLEMLDPGKSSELQRKAALNKPQEPESFVLPVRGLNIPFADVALQDGDSVIVEQLQVQLFTVIGLVNNPGSFTYPLDVQYNLMQAIGLAGGLDRDTEPRYAVVYRLKADGTIVHATFAVANAANGSRFADTLNTRIKPGDIVAVEHTPRTRTNRFLERIFNIQVGAYLPVWQR